MVEFHRPIPNIPDPTSLKVSSLYQYYRDNTYMHSTDICLCYAYRDIVVNKYLIFRTKPKFFFSANQQLCLLTRNQEPNWQPTWPKLPITTPKCKNLFCQTSKHCRLLQAGAYCRLVIELYCKYLYGRSQMMPLKGMASSKLRDEYSWQPQTNSANFPFSSFC